jgi:hypothetical protein
MLFIVGALQTIIEGLGGDMGVIDYVRETIPQLSPHVATRYADLHRQLEAFEHEGSHLAQHPELVALCHAYFTDPDVERCLLDPATDAVSVAPTREQLKALKDAPHNHLGLNL